jgi:molecular chaperone GrpE
MNDEMNDSATPPNDADTASAARAAPDAEDATNRPGLEADADESPQSSPTPVAGTVSETSSRAEASVIEQANPRAEAERYKEQWMRSAADFDNYRKRTRREVEDAKKSGREDLLREILPVFDNLERGIQSAQRATDVKAVADGLSMITKQFIDTLGRAGITKIGGVGSPFDPSVHEAIQQVETRDHPPGVVIAEVQPGYQQGERLVRAAMVVVSKAPSEQDDATN